MERKTKVHAEEGRQDLLITREFDLPVELLFKAHEDPELVEQWMGSKVVKLDNRKHGSWRLEKTDGNGNVVFQANGTYHEFIPNRKITRTFEMDNSPFDVQLEFMEFEALTADTSLLKMQVVYRSGALRDQMLKMPFEYGMNMAHDLLQKVMSKQVK